MRFRRPENGRTSSLGRVDLFCTLYQLLLIGFGEVGIVSRLFIFAPPRHNMEGDRYIYRL